jgi:hypothetical protein
LVKDVNEIVPSRLQGNQANTDRKPSAAQALRLSALVLPLLPNSIDHAETRQPLRKSYRVGNSKLWLAVMALNSLKECLIQRPTLSKHAA